MDDLTVLVIDSDPQNIEYLNNVLTFISWRCIPVTSRDEFTQQAETLRQQGVKLALLGPCRSQRTQTQLLDEIKNWDSQLPIFMLVKRGDQNRQTEEPLPTGVLDYLEVPLTQPQMTNALKRAEVYQQRQYQAGTVRPIGLFRSLAGNSKRIGNVRDHISLVADSLTTVLIQGGSGTGKEVVARNLHYFSSRRDRPFVPLNCGAIPENLLESELFGHEKGAFTGALTARQGRFQIAEGGTLFLDEIGGMSLDMQVKLLRVLQEKTFERVGGNKSITTNARIVAATNCNLEQAIKDGKFREDLYYRLAVFPIQMPALRERIEDMPILIKDLVKRFEYEHDCTICFSSAAVRVLSQSQWPGNVRELANLIERLMILYPNREVEVADLPEKYRLDTDDVGDELHADNLAAMDLFAPVQLPKEGIDLRNHLNELEQNLIQQALDESQGVVAHAAKLLNMRRTTLVEKLRKFANSDSFNVKLTA